MAWIKRNLFFALSALVGLILMGGAGYFFYSNWDANRTAMDELNTAKTELDTLLNKKPFPTRENIEQAKAAQGKVREVAKQFDTVFAPSPEFPKVDEKSFKAILDKTVSQLQAGATNNGVNLPQPDYAFSFAGLTSKLNFPTNSIDSWMVQLHEVKNLCGVLYKAKVNTLEGIRRVPVSMDEAGTGTLDFLGTSSVTNESIIRTPYEVVVRGYSREVAELINGFLRSTNCYVIKNIDICPSSSLAGGGMSYGTTGTTRADPYARRNRRPMIADTAAATENNPLKPTTMVSEGVMRAVILLEIVKPKAH